MKRPAIVLMLCLLAGLLAWWELREAQPAVDQPGPEPEAAAAAKPVPGTSAAHAPSAMAGGAGPQISTVPVAVPPAAPAPAVTMDDKAKPQDEVKTGPRFKRAYLLRIDKGAVTLLDAQDIEGDFSTEREKLDEWSGMLRCRLVSEKDAVLAEEVLPAPDSVCAVLDAQSRPVTLNVQRPVVFQVRLPRVKGASHLHIYRIIEPGAQPLEGLLASIPLPPS